jgi:hypothetical protein
MKIPIVAVAACVFIAAPAWGQVWNEVGDAGDLPGTAQVPTGAGPLNTIFGTIGPGSDADMYLIRIVDVANFRASTTFNITTVDTQLWLFDLNGIGITFDDDDPGGAGLQSTITGVFLPGPGDYYLAVSQYDWDAQNAAGLDIWMDTPYNVERMPDGPGAPGPVAGWAGSTYSDGPYQIDLVGVQYIPAPGVLALLGLAGLVGRRRR